VNGNISGDSTGLALSGRFRFSGDASYSGATTVTSGSLSIGNGGTTGSLASNVLLSGSSELNFSRSDDFTYDGVVSGTGTLWKYGGGILTVTNQSTNDGVNILQGAIKFGTSSAGFGTNAEVVVNSGTELNMNGFDDTFGALVGSGSVTQGAGNLTLAGSNEGAVTFSGNITGTGDFVVGRPLPTGASDQPDQVLTGNGNQLGNVIVNAGVLTFNGTATTGTVTVNGGSLLINTAVTTGAVEVNGGTLSGTGGVAQPVMVNSGGTITAGSGGGNSMFSMAALVLQPGSMLHSTLGAAGAPLGVSDVLNVTGASASDLTLNGGQIEISTVNGFTSGRYRLINYAGPAFAGALSNLSVSQDGFDSITLIENTVDRAIDADVVVTERNWADDTGNGNWSVGGNWGSNPTQPNARGAIANFADTASSNPAHTVVIDDADKTVGVVNLNSVSGYAITASGANKLILDTWGADAAINVTNGSHTIAAPILLKKKTDITVSDSDTLTISGNITESVAGTGAITKSGPGKLVLTDMSNTYQGGFLVNEGTLQGNAGSIPTNIVNNAAVIFDQTTDGTLSSSIQGTGTVTKIGSGQLNIDGAMSFTGGFTISEGVVVVSSDVALGPSNSSVTINNGTTLSVKSGTHPTLLYHYTVNGDFTLGQSTGGTGDLIMIGTIDLGGAVRTITLNNTYDAIGATISNGGLIINGGAGTLNLYGRNTYSGDTTLNSGTTTPGPGGTFGNGTGTLNLNGGKLQFISNRSNAPIANPINLMADTLIEARVNEIGIVTVPFSNTLGGTVGTLTLRNSGTTRINTFQPRFSGDGFNFSRPIIVDNGPLGKTSLTSVNTTGTSHTFSGVISGNGSYTRTALTAQTGGTTILTAANTYSGGTTVFDGLLLVNNTSGSGTGSGAVTVGGSTTFRGTLGGTGLISGPITVDLGGTLAPGSGGIGTLTATANVTLQTNAHFAIEVNGTSADKLIVGGNLDLSGIQYLDVSGSGFGPWTIATYSTLFGTFNSVTPGYTVDYSTPGLIILNTAGVAGDFNHDNVADSADYVTWRKGLGTTYSQSDYDVWRSQFGQSADVGSGDGANAAVPEASTLVLLLTVFLSIFSARHRY
jgi:autotransporter-associated beta strand protein